MSKDLNFFNTWKILRIENEEKLERWKKYNVQKYLDLFITNYIANYL